MSIVQIGARLVRQFGEGKNLRKVVTETLNGKTFTKVLDSNGNTILDRAKKIDRYEVGNKKVSTITKVSDELGHVLKKTVTDRVYNAESGLLGVRRTNFSDIGDGYTEFEKIASYKWSENRSIAKSFNDGIAIGRKVTENKYFNYLTLLHNDKGLPMPTGGNPADFKGMSLAGMRRWNVLHNSDQAYAPAEFRLGYLDKQDEVLGTIHDLDKFF